MNREDAIDYLKRKGKIEGKTTFSKGEAAEIEKVVRRGKIYGDPFAEVE